MAPRRRSWRLSLALPVGAADTQGTLAIVNGIPGKRVDVCLNGNEIKSNLGYGGNVFKDVVGTGNKNLKFYAHDPRTCRGQQVGQESFTLDPAEDLTIVVTKNPDKVVVFDNAGLGEIRPRAHRRRELISSGDTRPSSGQLQVVSRSPRLPVAPAADPVWVKGDQISSSLARRLHGPTPRDPARAVEDGRRQGRDVPQRTSLRMDPRRQQRRQREVRAPRTRVSAPSP